MSENPHQPPVTQSRAQSPPVRMKVWGLIWMRRRTYLVMQAVVFGLLALILLARCTFQVPKVMLADSVWSVVWEYFGWAVIAVAVLEVGETVVVLGKFKARQRQAASGGHATSTRDPTV